jgi:hypothetical protein
MTLKDYAVRFSGVNIFDEIRIKTANSTHVEGPMDMMM